ncbi:EGF-like repeat and discoidin I-like domain-containing protein 3 [Magallana gigas]|uniref:EGF-like repeat and discoidin I-like domain-containing protein 3 n=1 Tax=Magallana gigas TaxID=29159 RepID=UPI003342966C
MRGFQCLLLCVLLYSASVDAFGECDSADDDGSCPDNATCEDEDEDETFECECKDGFDEIDSSVTVGGTALTICVDLGVCSPLDNEVDDCGKNGTCKIFQNEFGIVEAACICDKGYYGEKCDKLITTTTMPTTPTTGTTKRSGYGPLIPIIGGGALLLALLAGGAAAVASSSG